MWNLAWVIRSPPGLKVGHLYLGCRWSNILLHVFQRPHKQTPNTMSGNHGNCLGLVMKCKCQESVYFCFDTFDWWACIYSATKLDLSLLKCRVVGILSRSKLKPLVTWGSGQKFSLHFKGHSNLFGSSVHPRALARCLHIITVDYKENN